MYEKSRGYIVFFQDFTSECKRLMDESKEYTKGYF